MLVALILVSIGFAITLFMLLFGQKGAAATSGGGAHRPQALEADTKARAAQLEGELARRKKELEEQRTQANDLKAQLAQAKKKLFEQREADKSAHELARARAEVERSASAQLESTRAELAHALSELQRLRAEQEAGGKRGPRAAAAPAPQQIAAPTDALVVNAAVQVPATAPAPAAAEPARRYRELNDADREKMERLEHTANKERARAAELEKELKKHRSRADTAQRVNNVMKGELDLVKDKFKALEKRLNRTLLERDLMRRAIKDLEKRTGTLAERTELTPDEVASSDKSVEDRQAAEAAQQAQAQAAHPAPEAAPAAGEEKSGTVG